MSYYRKSMTDAYREMYPLNEEVELDEAKYTRQLMKDKSVVDYVKSQQAKNRKRGITPQDGAVYHGANWVDLAAKSVGMEKMSLSKKKAFDWDSEYEAVAKKLGEEVEVDEAKMSSSQIDRLKKAYEPMRGKKISTDNANKLSAMMNKIGKDKDSLIQLFKADIPFVSQSAATQLISKHGMKGAEINKLREDTKEEVEIDEAMLRGRDYEYDEKEGVVKISKKNFAKVHKDQKGTDKSKPTMMVLTKKGTSLVPVKFTEEVELHELTPDEKKLINQMYDKKGNLTPIGKKVMDHGKKIAGKNEEADLDEKLKYEGKFKKGDTIKSFDFQRNQDDYIIGKITGEEMRRGAKVYVIKITNDSGKKSGGRVGDTGYVPMGTSMDWDGRIVKEEVEVDEKKKEPVFKGTPTQIKKQMKDWKKKHDKVKIGEEELDEALEQYVVIAGPGDNNQKILDIFKGAGSALKKAKKVRDDWNKKNKSKIKLDKKGKPIAAHMARIAQLASTASVDGVPIKKGDDISWSQFNQRIVKEEVELDEAGIMGKQGVVYSSRQLKDRKKEMMVKPPGREEDVIVIDKKDWLKYKKKGYVQAEETNLPNESSKQFKFAFIGLGHEGPSFEAYEFGTDEYRKYLEDMTPMEGARSDAMKDMKRAGWLKSKDLDKDDTATDDDRKAASKNILVQLKKTFDTEGKSDIVFLDKKKKKVPLDVAKAVLKKYVTFKRSDEKLKFQNKIAKSYKDMLQAIKENAIYDTENLTILDRIEFKIKEKKNG